MANTFAAKLSVAFVAIAMALSMVAPAQAATAEEMQAQIDALMAQLAALTSTPAASTASGCYTFTRSLTIGSQGADVTALQNALIKGGYSVPAGATGYFGSQTAAAVAAWQTANAVSPAAGYFGPVSQAKFAATCSDDSSDDEDDSTDDEDDSSSSDLSGEASLDVLEVKDGDDTDIEEGQEAAPVADINIEFADGDAKITRLDIALDATTDGNDEIDPWDVFEEVSLWVDGDEVATMTADDEDEYLDSDFGTIRFSNLDIVAMEDEEVTITVGVTVQGSVDGTSDGADWDLAATGLRFVDADDVTTTETTAEGLQVPASSYSADNADFTIDEQGGDDELIVKSSSEDPDATTIQVEESEKSDFTTIFAYDLDSDDSTNDIDLNELTVAIVTPTDVVSQVVSDIQLVIDGETFDDVTWTNNSTASATAAFDIDGDFTIEAGERVTVEVQVEFAGLTSNYDEGDTIFASTTSDTIDAEGADDLSLTQLDGTATGDTHTLRTLGVVVDMTDATETSKANTDGSLTDDEGVYEIEFTVEAFEEDLYIDDNATRGTTESNTGLNFIITSGGTASTTGTAVATVDSSAELDGGRYFVAQGESETFTLTVEFDPAGAGGSYKVQLYSVNFNNTNDDADTQQVTTPTEDFETGSLTI